MVTKSVHMDHSDLSMWIDSMRKIKFREFDTPEELSEYEKWRQVRRLQHRR